jgi:glutathione-independent formaldehyde dehydrogenase
MAAHSAALRGASQVFVVDYQPDRLSLAEKFGATAIDLSKVDVVKAIMDATEGFGVDSGVEAVGYQAHDHTGEEHPGMAMDNLISVARGTGAIGVVGV